MSLKTAVMTEIPYLEEERSCARPGRPRSEFSTWQVTSFSTSNGDFPGATETISTCTLVTSGNASMGSVRSAANPTQAAIKAAESTSHLWRMEK